MEGGLPSNLNTRTCSPRITPKSRNYQELFFSEVGEGVGVQYKENTDSLYIYIYIIYIYIIYIYILYIYIYINTFSFFCSSSRNQHLESCNQ